MKIAATIIAALALAIPVFAANSSSAVKTRSRHNAARMSWAPQTLSGTIEMVEPAQRLMVIQTAGGVPFDLDIGRQTRILNGTHRVSLENLTQDVNQNVRVRFIPERRGDVAASIRVGGTS